jgi:hypothetical protein
MFTNSSAGTVGLFASRTDSIGFPALTFSTSDTERARIDSSGRLLVGTSTSSAFSKLVVAGYPGGPTGVCTLSNTNATPAGTEFLGQLEFTAANQQAAATIRGDRDGGTWTAGSSQPSKLVFSTTADGASSPTERMRLNNAGQLNIYANESVVLSRTGSTAGTTDALYYGLHSATSTANGTISFVVFSNGNVRNSNNSYGQYTSDERFKQDIADAPSQWDDIKAVRLKKYRWKSEPDGEMLLGPIAQELREVCPGLIETRSADAQDVELSNGAVQEGEIGRAHV